MSSQTAIPAERWEAHKSEIVNLYIDQELPLDQVISAMKERGLHASKQQYARHFKKWQVSKNRKAAEWKNISKILACRIRQGKASVVFINDQQIPMEKVRKETRRYDLPSLIPKHHVPELMNHIRVCTPTRPIRNSPCAEISQCASQFGQLDGRHSTGGGQCSASIVIENPPSLEFMDLLDLNVEKNEDTLTRHSSTLSPHFLDDVKGILQLCDASLQLIGFSSPKLFLGSGSATVQYNPLKRLHEQSSSIQCLSTKQALPASIQLLKVVVSLSANGYLGPTNDDTFQDLVEILQEVDPIPHFLRLISDHDLFWILERVINMHTAATDATDIFAGNMLPHAIDLGLHEVTRLLLQSKCPLEAVIWRESGLNSIKTSGQFTSLGLAAIFQRDLDLVRRLTAAGASVHNHHRHESVLGHVLNEWHGTSLSDSDIILFQCLLDAHATTFKPCCINMWSGIVMKALYLNEMNFYKIVLEYLLRFIGMETYDAGFALVAAITINQTSILESVLSNKQHRIHHLRQDRIFQLVFRSALVTIISRPNGELLRLLIDNGPDICNDFGFDIDWVLKKARNADKDMILLLWHHGHIYFNESSKAQILYQALRHEWFDILRIIRNQGIDLHQYLSPDYYTDPTHNTAYGYFYEGCLVHHPVVQDYFLERSDFLDFILEDPVSMSNDTVLCLLNALARTGRLTLLERFVEQFESKYSRSYAFLETPKLLLFVMGLKDSELLSTLIRSRIRFDRLNEFLSRSLGELWREFGGSREFWWDQGKPMQKEWPRFSHPPEILASALANGLLPSQNLVIMCALYRSVHCAENLRLVLEAAEPAGAPLLPEDLTGCLEMLLQIFALEDRVLLLSNHLADTEISQNHVEALRLLVKFGATVEIPWLKDFLENSTDHCLNDDFVWRTLRHGTGPLHIAVMDGNESLLEELLDKGILPCEQYSSAGFPVPLTPLQCAAERENWKAMNLLLQNGADINAPAHPDGGETALQLAASHGNLNMASEFIRLGADINAPAAKFGGITALESAAHRGRLDMVHLLINHNPDLSKLRKDCKRASRVAKFQGYSVLATILEDHARRLAERLGVDHGEEIDDFCICDLYRHPAPNCEKCGPSNERHREKDSARFAPCCRNLANDNHTANEIAA